MCPPPPPPPSFLPLLLLPLRERGPARPATAQAACSPRAISQRSGCRNRRTSMHGSRTRGLRKKSRSQLGDAMRPARVEISSLHVTRCCIILPPPSSLRDRAGGLLHHLDGRKARGGIAAWKHCRSEGRAQQPSPTQRRVLSSRLQPLMMVNTILT